MNNLGRSITPAIYVREKQGSKLPTYIAVDAKLDWLEVGCFIFLRTRRAYIDVYATATTQCLGVPNLF